MFRNACGKVVPQFRYVLLKRNKPSRWGRMEPVAARKIHLPSRRDPFTQMENLIRDMEHRFWKEVDYSFPWASRLPRFLDVSATESKFGSPTVASTDDTFKLVFNFPNSKPEDIKVNLKDKLLTVEGKAEEVNESSKFHQSFSYQYTIPDGVDVEALESLMSNEGILTIQAPKKVETRKSIPINRE